MEYVPRDLEGSDSESRRKSATELIRALLDQLEKQTSSIVLQYVSFYLEVSIAHFYLFCYFFFSKQKQK